MAEVMNLDGKITKILANFYYVTDIENKVWECFARARMLKEGKYLFVGDNVEIETSSTTQGVIVNAKERKNKISKPPVANVDQIIIVFSSIEPDFDEYNLDRYLSFVRYELSDERCLVCINKIDLKKIKIDKVYEKSGFEILYVSALTKEGLDNFVEKLKNKTSVLAGPSGVGKSSIIKALVPHASVQIGDLSSIKQGKHITRNVQLIDIKYGQSNNESFLVDTPGFTQFSFGGLNLKKVLDTFKDLKDIKCAFYDCLHNGEEDCVIDEMIKKGKVSESRYNSYLKILAEAQKEIIYETKQESKTKSISGKKNSKASSLPKIDQEKRAKSRKKEKQELLKIQREEEE